MTLVALEILRASLVHDFFAEHHCRVRCDATQTGTLAADGCDLQGEPAADSGFSEVDSGVGAPSVDAGACSAQRERPR